MQTALRRWCRGAAKRYPGRGAAAVRTAATKLSAPSPRPHLRRRAGPTDRRAAPTAAASDDALRGRPSNGGGDDGPGGDGGAAAAGIGLAHGVAEAVLLRPYRAYAHALEKRPLLTKACTSLVGFAIGDVIAQSLAHPGAPLDLARVARLAAYGGIIDGPLGGKWYDFLEAKVYPDRPRSGAAVLTKTALDQVVYASAGTVLFLSVITLLEGRPEAVGAVVAAKLWPTLVANWAIWPLAHLINFRFVPAPFRIAYNNVVSIGWLALLSAITHSKSGEVMAQALAALHAFGLAR